MTLNFTSPCVSTRIYMVDPLWAWDAYEGKPVADLPAKLKRSFTAQITVFTPARWNPGSREGWRTRLLKASLLMSWGRWTLAGE